MVLKITSVDVTHGFAFTSGFAIDKPLRPGEETTIEFDFRCTVFCGSGLPTMTGKLIVEE